MKTQYQQLSIMGVPDAMATVEFNERLYSSPVVMEAGNGAFGMWVRCLLYSADWDFPECVINDRMALLFGTRRQLKKLLTPSPPWPALLEVVDIATVPGVKDPETWPGEWYRPANWQVGSTFRPAWTLRYTRNRIPEELRSAVYERDGYRCVRCGSQENLTLDHIHPHSKGGKDTEDNLQTLCQSCNSKKRDRVE